MLSACEADRIGFMPWNPLARGDLASSSGPLSLAADRNGATQAQIALAWLLHRSPVMLPIPGRSRRRCTQTRAFLPADLELDRADSPVRQTSESENAHVQVSDDPRVGTEVAGYRMESLLGWGRMSVVYLGEDLRLKRRVALKLLAAASIDHPNIVPIYEAGRTEDLFFIAMRYVEGRDLGTSAPAPRSAESVASAPSWALDHHFAPAN